MYTVQTRARDEPLLQSLRGPSEVDTATPSPLRRAQTSKTKTVGVAQSDRSLPSLGSCTHSATQVTPPGEIYSHIDSRHQPVQPAVPGGPSPEGDV